MASREDDTMLPGVQAVQEPSRYSLNSSSSADLEPSSNNRSKQGQGNRSLPALPIASQASPISSNITPRHNRSSASLKGNTEGKGWTVIDSFALHRPSTPSFIQQDQSAESDGISSSSERLRDQPLGTPTAQTSFYQPSVDLGQTAPHHGPSHTSSISNPTPGLSTKEAFSTTAENPIPTAHRLDHSPLISEQPQISECVTPPLSRGGSAEASGWFPDGPNAHYTAGPVTDPPPDTRPSAEDSEQISSIYHTQEPVIEHPGDTLRHSAEHTRDLLAAAEAGGSAWYKPKRTRSSSSSTSAEMTGPASPAWVKERLEQHNMFQDLGEALTRFPRLRSAVDKIISRDRKSAASHKEFQNFKGKLQYYQNQNEDTLLAMALPAIIKDDRTIQVPSGLLSDEAVWESVGYFDSGIIVIVNREYQRGYVRFRNGAHHIDAELVAKMAKLKDQGVTNPKPDRVYGIRRDMFKFPAEFQMPEEIRDYLEILQDLHLPFLIIEGKAEGGSSAEARNQACRGGAALVHCYRLLRALLGFEDKVGADLQTFVFSATYTDGLLDIWVHWAEVREQEDALPIYHMSLVSTKAIRDGDHFRQARMILHNILDWGSGERFVGLKPLYEAVVAYAESQRQQTEKKKSGNPQKTGHGEKDQSSDYKKQKTTHP
ncbi:MAG: hypothetical protein Q9211_000644 [Gyalolechia sp. 1 TL-2023]